MPSAATVISLVALFVAMGGTAYAATGGTFVLGHANSASTVSVSDFLFAGAVVSATNTANGDGVHGTSSGTGNSGVSGQNNGNGFGVTGTTGNGGVAILGDAGALGFLAGLFIGDVNVDSNVDVDGTVDATDIECTGCMDAGDLDPALGKTTAR